MHDLNFLISITMPGPQTSDMRHSDFPGMFFWGGNAPEIWNSSPPGNFDNRLLVL